MPGNQRIAERLRLKEPDLLEISVEMTAPQVFAGPFKDTFPYKRRRDHWYTNESNCAEADRSLDRGDRTEQFDLTPPSDLPPPPGG